MKCYVFITVLLVVIAFGVEAQDNTRGESDSIIITPYEDLDAPSNVKVKKISRRKFKKTYLYWFYNHHEQLRQDFYKRKKKLRKGYRRMARIMNKPQYRDHAYFGHKRKPKIRPVGKRKFCSECGIVH